MKITLMGCVLVLSSIILVVGSVFAIQFCNVKNPDFKCSGSYSDTDYIIENNQKKAGDFFQGLILAPMVITKTFCDNREIISS